MKFISPFTAAVSALFLSTACSLPSDDESLAKSQKGDAIIGLKTSMKGVSATCAVRSLKDESLISEKASFQVAKGKSFKLNYEFTVETEGARKIGRQEITGVLDQEFDAVFQSRITYFLLSRGELKSSYEGQLTQIQLGKTEVLLKDGRLIIEENDIVLDLKGCELRTPIQELSIIE